MAIAIGLLKMLLDVQQAKKTGAVDVRGEVARVRIFVEDGAIVHADEGTASETLGRLLVKEQVLSEAQYASAIAELTALRASGRTTKLGELVVERGLLTREQLHAALAAQVQEKVLRALAWPQAALSFLASDGPLAVAGRHPTSLEPLVLAALRAEPRDALEALLAQALDRHVSLRSDVAVGGTAVRDDALARLSAFRFPRAEESFARSLDGSRTMRELLAEAPPSVDAPAVLAAMLLGEALDLQAAPPSRSARAPSLPPAAAEEATAARPPAEERVPSDAPPAPLPLANEEERSTSDAPPAAPAAAASTAPARRSSRTAVALAGLVVATGAAAFAFGRAQSDGGPPVAASAVVAASVESTRAEVPVATSKDASNAVISSAAAQGEPAQTITGESADASADADASYDAGRADLPAIGPHRGLLELPAAADTHRVYVDGRLVGAPPSPIVIPCGPRVVKIGSHGRERAVTVPCGGTLAIPYP